MTISTRAPRRIPSPRRRGPLMTRLALAVAAPLMLVGLAACDPTPQQESVRSHVNESRRAHGVPELGDDVVVRLKAQAWADRLAQTGTLSHSVLGDGLDGVSWAGAAENVGRAASVGAVHESYLRSPQHRRNILDPRWDRIGTGHAVGSDGLVYTVLVFVDLR